MTQLTRVVKVINASLDNYGENIILRGILLPESLPQLQTGEYQREVLPQSKFEDLIEAVEKGKVPDIELGVRGGSFKETSGVWTIKDPVFIIDGLQRVSAGTHLLGLGKTPHIGAMIHFNTNEEWERDRFRILNAKRTRLSPNIHLKNFRHESKALDMLFNLSTSNDRFVMKERITWTQQAKRNELISAATFCKVVGSLHSHFGPGRLKSFQDAGRHLDTCAENVGIVNMRENVVSYFDLIDRCWGIKSVTYAALNPQIKAGFLVNLALVLADHSDFWDGRKLAINQATEHKLKQLKMTDPGIRNLAGLTSGIQKDLYNAIVEHINSGKRKNHLRRWNPYQELPQNGTDHEEEA